jgi:hypothetical protein
MERDGSGVSALVGLDEFVVTAQLFDDDSGEWFLAIETTGDRAWCETCAVRAIGHGCRRVVVRDLPMAGRRCGWCGPSASGAAASRPARPERGPRSPMRSPHGRCSPNERGPRSAGGSVLPSTRSPRRPETSGCPGTRRWPQCVTTADPGSITSPGSVHPRRSGLMRRRSWRPPQITRRCW